MKRATYILMTGVELEVYTVLTDDDGMQLLTSGANDTAEAALRVIAAVREHGAFPEAYGRWDSEAGYGFTLRGPEGPLASSPCYSSENEREAALECTPRCAATDAVVDLRASDPKGASTE